ncbi:hypothetical protein NAEGRDRAFT_78876 [Naegleria gruberi]|uniref:Mediator of RNA polymerase II transcription subunit 25 n=1 Tax=Naegleria gruberi TaxID=5762 RepID=D2V7B3_NAEGR|nr:uncharacterized protein NAEGRDRAFT_78876 [Naegleria gruberi]EFC47346.1 hypothetical protein NAEGRDRAFT_78876 [Naegleria gruberi]|eukprot:XP_002680090.1 hypothetical protein NAEGRDRAFT_78876 [Naegleria gruberi strain NEG-M]
MLSNRSGSIPKSSSAHGPSDNQPKQICILIDTTTGMKTYFAYFLNRVIVPYMLYLRNKNTEFSAVLFQNYPPNGDFLVKVIPFIKDYSTFYQILEGLKEKFYAGGIAHSCVSEALATSITDLEWDKDALKYVMICSSTPSEHPCILNGMYVGKNAMEIVKDMVKKGLIISILSPSISRKWKKITEACKLDPQSMVTSNTSNSTDPFSISEGLSRLILDAMNLHYPNTEYGLLIDLRGVEKDKLKLQPLEKNDKNEKNDDSNSNASANTNNSSINTNASNTTHIKTEKDVTPKLPPKASVAKGVVIPPVITTVTTPPPSFLAPSTAPTTVSSATNNTSTTPPTTVTTPNNQSTTTTPTNGSTPTNSTTSGTTSTPNSTGSTPSGNSTSSTAAKTINDYTIGPNHVQIHKLTFSIDSPNSIIGHLEGYAKSEIVVDSSKWPKDIKITKNLMSLKTSIIANLVKKDMKVHLWKLTPSTQATKIPTLLNNMAKKKYFITAPIDDKSSLLLFPYQYLKIYFDKTKEQETITANTIASEPVFVSFPIGTELIEKCSEKPPPTQPQPSQALPPNLNPPTAPTVPTTIPGYQNTQGLILSNPMPFPYNFVMPFNMANMPNMPNMPNLPFNQPMYMVNGGMNLMNNPNNRNNANNNNNNNNNNNK